MAVEDLSQCLQTVVMELVAVLIVTANIKQLYSLFVGTAYANINPVVRCLLVNLSVADMAVGLLIAVPAVLMDTTGHAPLRNHCDVGGMAIGLCAVSMLFMMSVCIAVHLFTDMDHLGGYSRLGPLWSACNWLIVFAYVGYGFVRFDRVYHYDALRLICTIRWGYSPLFSVAGLLIYIVLPTVGIALSLRAVSARLDQSRQTGFSGSRTNPGPNAAMTSSSSTTSIGRDLTNHVRVILAVHVLIWSPTVIDIGYTAVYGVPPPRLLAWLPAWLAFFNSFLNVIVYGRLARCHGDMCVAPATHRD